MHFLEEAERAATPALTSGSRSEAATGGRASPTGTGAPRSPDTPTLGCRDVERRSFPRQRVCFLPSRLLLRRAGGHRPGAQRLGHCQREGPPSRHSSAAGPWAQPRPWNGGRDGRNELRIRRCLTAPAPSSRCLRLPVSSRWAGAAGEEEGQGAYSRTPPQAASSLLPTTALAHSIPIFHHGTFK